MELLKTKTFWAGIAALASLIGFYVGGELSLQDALPRAFEAFGLIFLRGGVMKISPKP